MNKRGWVVIIDLYIVFKRFLSESNPGKNIVSKDPEPPFEFKFQRFGINYFFDNLIGLLFPSEETSNAIFKFHLLKKAISLLLKYMLCFIIVVSRNYKCPMWINEP